MLIYECVRQQINNIKAKAAAATHTHAHTHTLMWHTTSEREKEKRSKRERARQLNFNVYFTYAVCKMYICMQHVSRTINVSLYGPHAAAFCPFPSEIVRRIVHETIQSTANQSEAKQCKVKRIRSHMHSHSHLFESVCVFALCFIASVCFFRFASLCTSVRACLFVLSDESGVRDLTTKFSFLFAARMLSKSFFCMLALQKNNNTRRNTKRKRGTTNKTKANKRGTSRQQRR